MINRGRLQKFSPRPFGGGHKRKLPIPDERTLHDMSLADLEDLIAKIQQVITRKRRTDALGYHRVKVYAEIVKLLEGKTTTSGVLLTEEVIKAIEPKDLQFIDVRDHNIEMAVHAALKPFRDKDGKLKV